MNDLSIERIICSVSSTIAIKINDNPKRCLLAHNNISQICYCGQISLQSAAVNCSFSDTFGGNIYFAGDVPDTPGDMAAYGR